MAVTLDQASGLVQHRTRVLDRTRETVGLLDQIYVDDDTSEPLWAAVVFDEPATVETVVPLHNAHVEDGDLVTSRGELRRARHASAHGTLPVRAHQLGLQTLQT